MNWRVVLSIVKIQTFLENMNELEKFSDLSSVTHKPVVAHYAMKELVSWMFLVPRADAILCTVCFQAADMACYTCL